MLKLLLIVTLFFGGVVSAQATEKGSFCGEPYEVAKDFVGCFETCECSAVASACKHAAHSARHCGNARAKARAKVEKVRCDGDKDCEAEVKAWLKEELESLNAESKEAVAFCDSWQTECKNSCSESF